jgi:hypothetical protein
MEQAKARSHHHHHHHHAWLLLMAYERSIEKDQANKLKN